MLIDERCAEHRELEAQAVELLGVVAGHSPDSASVAVLRWRMVRALSDYCAWEECAASAPRDCQDHGLLVERFHAYILDWPVSRIAREWAEFGRATQAMLASIAERMGADVPHLHARADRMIARCAA
jgi:hypothetical protein